MTADENHEEHAWARAEEPHQTTGTHIETHGAHRSWLKLSLILGFRV
jgi:hypothetical protein